jgi:hypothetical protein
MRKIFFIFLLLTSFQLVAFSQQNKTVLFSDTTTQFLIKASDLNNFEKAQKKETVTIKLSENLSFSVLINMNEWNNKFTHTIGSKIQDYEEAYLTISFYRTSNETEIAGEIFSKIEKIGYKISNDNKGNIIFNKIESNKIIVE